MSKRERWTLRAPQGHRNTLNVWLFFLLPLPNGRHESEKKEAAGGARGKAPNASAAHQKKSFSFFRFVDCFFPVVRRPLFLLLPLCVLTRHIETKAQRGGGKKRS